jgi:hypothetical protein
VVNGYPFSVAILPERGWQVKPEVDGKAAVDMSRSGRFTE